MVDQLALQEDAARVWDYVRRYGFERKLGQVAADLNMTSEQVAKALDMLKHKP